MDLIIKLILYKIIKTLIIMSIPFEKSFASCEKSKYWSNKNKKDALIGGNITYGFIFYVR
jgi:hypothetical protein